MTYLFNDKAAHAVSDEYNLRLQKVRQANGSIQMLCSPCFCECQVHSQFPLAMQERSRESRARFLSFRSNLLCSQSSKLGRSRTLDLEKAILWANSGIYWEI